MLDIIVPIYYHQILMAHRPQPAPFTPRRQVLSQEGMQHLRSQIQYYLSLKNLITDHFLTNIINSNKGGWVAFQILSTFNQIQKIFTQFFPKLGSGLKRLTLKTACEQSQQLEVNDDSVRRKNDSVTVDTFYPVLYLQGDASLQEIKNILADMNVDCEKVSFRQGKMWYFIEFHQQTKQSMEQIYFDFKSRPQTKERCLILQAEQFLTAEKQYAKIVGITPLETPIMQSEEKYKFPPNRIVSYREMKQFKTVRKTRQIKPRGKHCQTRLPKMYIRCKSSQRSKKQREEKDDLIQIEGLQLKKKARGSQEARQYCLRKIQQRKIRKAKAKQQRKMQIEEKVSKGE